MKHLTLVISEEISDQLVATAEVADQSAEQLAAVALPLGLSFTTASGSSPSLIIDLYTLQSMGARGQYLDW